MKTIPSIFKITSFLFFSLVLTLNLHAQDENDSKKHKEKEPWETHTQSNRYFWAPNALSLKRGEAYYQNIGILFNQAGFGVTDNFTLGVGFVPIFLGTNDATPIWLTSEISFPIIKDKISLGIGVLGLGLLSNKENVFSGITYGLATFGRQDVNFSIGLGYGYTEEDWTNSPTITASGMLRINKRSYIMAENYFVGSSKENIMFSIVGGRTIWKHLSLDYGWLLPISEIVDGETGEQWGLPWLGLVIPFGKKN